MRFPRFVAGGGRDDFDEMIAKGRELCLAQVAGLETKQGLHGQANEDGGIG